MGGVFVGLGSFWGRAGSRVGGGGVYLRILMGRFCFLDKVDFLFSCRVFIYRNAVFTWVFFLGFSFGFIRGYEFRCLNVSVFFRLSFGGYGLIFIRRYFCVEGLVFGFFLTGVFSCLFTGSVVLGRRFRVFVAVSVFSKVVSFIGRRFNR